MADSPIKGLDSLTEKLSAISKGLDAETKKALYLSGLKIEEHAKRSIAGGGKTGKVYRRGKVTHVASAPGEAPATDTGRLVNSIHIEAVDNGDAVKVSAGSGVVKYAAMLEFGTSRMEARPFMGPALAKAKPEIEALMKRAVVTVTSNLTK